MKKQISLLLEDTASNNAVILLQRKLHDAKDYKRTKENSNYLHFQNEAHTCSDDIINTLKRASKFDEEEQLLQQEISFEVYSNQDTKMEYFEKISEVVCERVKKKHMLAFAFATVYLVLEDFSFAFWNCLPDEFHICILELFA